MSAASDGAWNRNRKGDPRVAGKLVLHIGTHKTGTTTLQSTLESNTDALRRAGFIYPTMPEKWEHAARNRNGYWLNIMSHWNKYGIDMHTDYKKLVEAQTPETIMQFMKEFNASGNRLSVCMMPAE